MQKCLKPVCQINFFLKMILAGYEEDHLKKKQKRANVKFLFNSRNELF